MKKVLFIGLLTGALLFLQSNISKADSLVITPEMPKSGGVVLDNNGKILASSNSLLSTQGINIGQRTAINSEHWRWVYFQETFPYTPLGKKRANSNFLHRQYTHTSTAKVGSKSYRASAGKGKYSFASVTGDKKYTAEFYYNF